MRKRFAYLSVLILMLLATAGMVGFGCSATGGDNAFTTGTSGSGAGDAATSGAGGQGGEGGCLLDCGVTSAGQGGGIQGVIVIAPANPQLTVINGSITVQPMTASLNGNDITSNVTWIYDRPEIGDISGSVFTPTGLVGGVGTLTAQYSNSTGNTTVTVTISKVVDTVGVDPTQITELGNPSGGPETITISAPYNETVFPLGVLAPEVMWNGGGASDIYRLNYKEKYYEYTEYFLAPPPGRHITDQTDWSSIEESGSGAQSDPLVVSLNRLVGAVATQPVVQTWHIAQGRLKGSVYYWELPDACGTGNGRILRIKPDSPVIDQFFPASECYGCHTVSRDGKSMFASFDTSFPFPMQTIDLTVQPFATLGSIQQGAGVVGTFSAYNDTGNKLLVSADLASNPSGSLMNIIDSTTGQIITPGAMGTGCGEPAWSPDGKKIASICNLSGGGWIFDATGGNLAVADIDPSGQIISNQTTIVTAAGGTGRPAYPTFSPGSEWLAFGRPTQGSRSTGNGTLWLVAPDGSGLKQLKNADSDNQSFNPVFAPLRAGGYFWLVYVTRRDYGNRLVGANRQQLWITAIDDPPLAGDPSHPPFYIRGQEDCGKSENAYYALDPCKDIGEDCTSGVDCCNGQCVKDPITMQYVCGDPPDPGECSQDGNSCVIDSDCCNAPESKCIDGFCQQPPPT